jgi:predicted RND superfamily exporter protein
VDFAIHLMERFRRARTCGADLKAAIADATGATAPAIIIDALAVALGFGVLMLSQVPANARLGGLVVLSIVICLVATLVLLPALLRVFRVR